MRSDFSKVVTERPRRGSGNCYHDVRKRGPVNEDESASPEGMRRAHYRNTKEFSDLLGPLWRFLHSRVGRKWDDVYSEICANLKGRNTQQQHIIGHLWQYVERYVEVMPNGNLRSKGTRWYRLRDGDAIYSDFYIDPRDGLLKKAKGWRDNSWRRRPKVDPNNFTKDGHTYVRAGGVWFEMTVEATQDSYRSYPSGELVYYTKTFAKKRSLSGAELRVLGLENLPV